MPSLELGSGPLGLDDLQAIHAGVVTLTLPLRSSPALESAHALLREHSATLQHDRYLAPDLERATALVTDGSLARILRTLPGLPPLWTPV